MLLRSRSGSVPTKLLSLANQRSGHATDGCETGVKRGRFTALPPNEAVPTVPTDLYLPAELAPCLASIDAQLQKLRRTTCPFINLPEKSKGRWGPGITPAVMKRCHWVKPVLIAQVKFTEWTHDDQLRQPVFLGLRADKEAKDVVRE